MKINGEEKHKMGGTWIEFWGINKELITVVCDTVPPLNSWVNLRRKNGKFKLLKVIHVQYILDVNENIPYKVKVFLK